VPILLLMIVNVLSFSHKSKLHNILFGFGLLTALAQIALVLWPNKNFWQLTANYQFNVIKFNLAADNLTLVMLLAIGLVGLIALIVARGLINDVDQEYNFTNLWFIALTGMNGLVLATDIFSLYVFIEITAVASFILIALTKERDALEGAFKYVIFSSFATVLMLAAIALLVFFAGDTSFAAIANAIKANPGNSLILMGLILYLLSVFIKSGLIPFHGWLPDAYSAAPAITSIFIAGIVTKVVGIYPLIRFVQLTGTLADPLRNILLLVGGTSIVIAALSALGQTNFKRLLAYSSISQMGYIVLGLAAGSALGLAGAILHIFNHAVFKSLLFINAAAVEKQTGTLDIDKMGGLAEKMPYTGATSAIASLSTAGIPPLSGFWSKLLIIIALWNAQLYFYATVAVLASLLTLGYMLTLQRKVFFGQLENAFYETKEAGWQLVLPSLLLAGIILGLGLGFPWLINTWLIPIGKIL